MKTSNKESPSQQLLLFSSFSSQGEIYQNKIKKISPSIHSKGRLFNNNSFFDFPLTSQEKINHFFDHHIQNKTLSPNTIYSIEGAQGSGKSHLLKKLHIKINQGLNQNQNDLEIFFSRAIDFHFTLPSNQYKKMIFIIDDIDLLLGEIILESKLAYFLEFVLETPYALAILSHSLPLEKIRQLAKSPKLKWAIQFFTHPFHLANNFKEEEKKHFITAYQNFYHLDKGAIKEINTEDASLKDIIFTLKGVVKNKKKETDPVQEFFNQVLDKLEQTFEISSKILLSPSRKEKVVEIRYLGILLFQSLYETFYQKKISPLQIGIFFKRDRTTIMKAQAMGKIKLTTNPLFSENFHLLKEQIENTTLKLYNLYTQ